MSRNIRTFSTISRTLFRNPTSFTRQNGTVNVQHVRIVRPFITPRRIQKGTLWITILAVLYYRLDTLLDDEEEEETKKTRPVKEAVQQVGVAAELEKLGGEAGEAAGIQEQAEHQTLQETDDEDDDDLVPEDMPEDAWFIPLTWPRQCPPSFYKGTDPEWQSFIEFSQDRARSHGVKEELAQLIGHQMASHPQYQKFLGTPMIPGRYMLAIDFPDGPPPEYERFGIEITDDYVALTVRPINDGNLFRLRRAVWPVATGSSLWASCGALWHIQVEKIRKAFNIEPPSSHMQQRFPDGYTNLSRLLGNASSKSPEAKAEELNTEDANLTTLQSSMPRVNPKTSDRPWIFRPLPPLPEPSTELTKATTAFRRSLAKSWRQTFPPPPRGTFLVSGLVEVYGPKGICTIDVMATYDPRESRYVGIAVGVKRLQRRKQKPRG